METIEKIRKENFNYLARDKKCNSLDLVLTGTIATQRENIYIYF